MHLHTKHITDFNLEVKPRLPEAISGLQELAENLLYSWHRPIRELFISLDCELWVACQHNPTVFLRRIDETLLLAAAEDPAYLQQYQRVLSWFRDYCNSTPESLLAAESPLPKDTVIAYFCAEFGFHESFPIYSGGLGILAGDHCKAASDMGIAFVAIGLLYHEGYFTQIIDAEGHQIAEYSCQSFCDSPIKLLRDAADRPMHVSVPIADEQVIVKLWTVSVGRVQLILLDSDSVENSPENRRITRQLYGGDGNTRLQQEMILGIGGVRALAVLGIRPSVWHINEGHAAFSAVERARQLVQHSPEEDRLDFDAALEQAAAATLFTTHTPIAAGHDRFDQSAVEHYCNAYLRELPIDSGRLFALGQSDESQHQFNMTALALRGSRFHNAVSRIHGAVASRMEQYLWPQIPAAENPITYITNGVHVESFIHKRWAEIFDRQLPNWRQQLHNHDFWQALSSIDDRTWWHTHCQIKHSLLRQIAVRLQTQHHRNGLSQAMIERSTRYLSHTGGDLLVIGFARRFASYKRAGLLFLELERLAALVNDSQWPVIFIFAGKAHPDDEAGKALIKQLYQRSLEAQFIGRIILLEGYDIALARALVSGCDIWLNTPQYPLEACGTSGQKAAINGVVNLSIRDGWWDEGFSGDNGWAVAPHDTDYDADYRDRQEAIDVLDILQNQAIPAWQYRDNGGHPQRWLTLSRASMTSTIARFSAQRMVCDYIKAPYVAAAEQGARLAQQGAAQSLVTWKKRVAEMWSGVCAHCTEQPVSEIQLRETLSLAVAVDLNGLHYEDVVVECLLGEFVQQQFVAATSVRLDYQSPSGPPAEPSKTLFTLNWTPSDCGLKQYRLRLYPYHPLLSHPFELGCMLWL